MRTETVVLNEAIRAKEIRTQYWVNVRNKLTNTIEAVIDPKDIFSSSKVTKTCSSSNNFEIGGCFVGSLTLDIVAGAYRELSDKLIKNAKLEVLQYWYVDGIDKEDYRKYTSGMESYDNFTTLGTYHIDSVTSNDYKCTIIAYDFMYRLDMKLTEADNKELQSTTQSIKDIVDWVFQKTEGDGYAGELSPYPSFNYYTKVALSDDSTFETYRDVLRAVAQIYGGFAYCGFNGDKIIFDTFKSNSPESVLPHENLYSYTLSNRPTKITKFITTCCGFTYNATAIEDEDKDSSTVYLEENKFLRGMMPYDSTSITSNVLKEFEHMRDLILNNTFRGCEAVYRSFPLLELGDRIELSRLFADSGSTVETTVNDILVTGIEHSFDNRTTVISPDVSSTEQSNNYKVSSEPKRTVSGSEAGYDSFLRGIAGVYSEEKFVDLDVSYEFYTNNSDITLTESNPKWTYDEADGKQASYITGGKIKVKAKDSSINSLSYTYLAFPLNQIKVINKVQWKTNYIPSTKPMGSSTIHSVVTSDILPTTVIGSPVVQKDLVSDIVLNAPESPPPVVSWKCTIEPTFTSYPKYGYNTSKCIGRISTRTSSTLDGETATVPPVYERTKGAVSGKIETKLFEFSLGIQKQEALYTGSIKAYFEGSSESSPYWDKKRFEDSIDYKGNFHTTGREYWTSPSNEVSPVLTCSIEVTNLPKAIRAIYVENKTYTASTESAVNLVSNSADAVESVKALTNKVSSLETAMTYNLDKINSVESKTAVNTSDITSLTVRIENIEASGGNSDVDTLKADVETLKTNVSTNTSNITSLSANVSTNTSNITSLTTRVKALEDSGTGGGGTGGGGESSADVEQLKKDVATLQKSVSTNTSNITSLTTRVKAIEDYLATFPDPPAPAPELTVQITDVRFGSSSSNTQLIDEKYYSSDIQGYVITKYYVDKLMFAWDSNKDGTKFTLYNKIGSSTDFSAVSAYASTSAKSTSYGVSLPSTSASYTRRFFYVQGINGSTIANSDQFVLLQYDNVTKDSFTFTKNGDTITATIKVSKGLPLCKDFIPNGVPVNPNFKYRFKYFLSSSSSASNKYKDLVADFEWDKNTITFSFSENKKTSSATSYYLFCTFSDGTVSYNAYIEIK